MYGKRVLVLINPYGGDKTAPRIWTDVVGPIFEKVSIKSTPVFLTHQGHAREIASSFSATDYDGLVAISGDGVLNELLNGLVAVEMWICTRSPSWSPIAQAWQRCGTVVSSIGQ